MKHNLPGNWISDIGNNMLFVPGAYCLTYLMRSKFFISRVGDIFFYFFVLTIIELLSFYIKKLGVFDYKDIIGLFIGTMITYLFFKDNIKSTIT